MVWEGSDHPEVSLIYLSRSTKAPKRKLQTNGPVTKKAKKKTSSSDSSEDSSEEEKPQGPPAKKTGKAGQELGLAVPGKGFVVCLYCMADSYWDLCFFVQLYLPSRPVCLSILERLQPKHPRAAAVKNPVMRMRRRTKRKSLSRFATLGRRWVA